MYENVKKNHRTPGHFWNKTMYENVVTSGTKQDDIQSDIISNSENMNTSK